MNIKVVFKKKKVSSGKATTLQAKFSITFCLNTGTTDWTFYTSKLQSHEISVKFQPHLKKKNFYHVIGRNQPSDGQSKKWSHWVTIAEQGTKAWFTGTYQYLYLQMRSKKMNAMVDFSDEIHEPMVFILALIYVVI